MLNANFIPLGFPSSKINWKKLFKTNSDEFSFVFEKISREDLKQKILLNGGTVSASVNKNVILIVGENAGPSKILKADNLGIEKLTYSGFITKFKL